MARSTGATASNTRGMVLDLIRSGGVISRVDLVEESGLTAPTITRVVQSLLADSLVEEIGFGDSSGGKRPTLLQLNASARYAAGLSVDDSKLTYVLVDLSGQSIAQLESPRRGETAEALVERVGGELATFINASGIDRSQIVGLGVAISGLIEGPVVSLGGYIDPSFALEFPLEAQLSQRVGLPVVVGHDADCAAIGEYWSDRIPATRDFLLVNMATGIGSSLILEGRVFGGVSSNAGKIGHVVVDEHGPVCRCGSRGCLEMHAAPWIVISRAMEHEGLSARLGLSGERSTLRSEFSRIAAAAAHGDAECRELIRDSAHHIATAILSMVNVLDLDLVYLSGPAFAEAGDIYRSVIVERLDSFSFMRELHPVEVRLARVGLTTVALGAALTVFRTHLTPERA